MSTGGVVRRRPHRVRRNVTTSRRPRTWHTLCTVNAPPIVEPQPAGVFGAAAVALIAVGDPVRTRTVYSAMLFLIAIGVVLLALTVWLVRATKAEPEYLAPLELMERRKWRRADPVAQRRMLDAVRPEGAEPLSPTAPPPTTDDEFDRGPTLRGVEGLGADEVDGPPVVDAADGDAAVATAPATEEATATEVGAAGAAPGEGTAHEEGAAAEQIIEHAADTRGARP